jgi:hypothetical protein
VSLRAKLAIVDAAEADCAVRRAAITASWRGFKQEAEAAATPGRVIVTGLVTGFLAGLPRIGKGGGSLLGGKLFGAVLETAFTSISAAIAAGTAAAANTPGTPPEPATPTPAPASGQEAS